MAWTQSATGHRRSAISGGFTLVELLVVIAIMGMLLGLLFPALSRARESGRMVVCASNIRQLALANIAYSQTNKDQFVLAASNIDQDNGGTRRWHGVRKSAGVSPDPEENRFDPAQGPLALYLGKSGQVKSCPSFTCYDQDGQNNAFEASTGGYGYNAVYVGGRYDFYPAADPQFLHKAVTTSATFGQTPADTVMFTDAAMAQYKSGRVYLTEYSFCEPPYVQMGLGPPTTTMSTPSIHFRHAGALASVAWVDGHVDRRSFSFTAPSAYGVSLKAMKQLKVGWFGTKSNACFDLIR